MDGDVEDAEADGREAGDEGEEPPPLRLRASTGEASLRDPFARIAKPEPLKHLAPGA